MKVSAVVVTYNRLSLLKECISNLLNQSYELNNIFVINNKSDDGTEEYLNNINNSKIVPINSKKNLGGAGGFSLGTKMVYNKSDSDYFWLMDDDTMATHSALLNMMNKAKELNYNFGFLCSNVRWWKNQEVALTNIPLPAKDWNSPLISNLVKVQSTSFVSVLVPRDLVKKLGLPIAKMFIWGDDVEFTTRLSNYNSKSYLVTNSIIKHKSANNNAYSIINSSRIKRYKYGIRNKIYIKRKYDNFRHLFKQLLSYIFIFFSVPFCSKNKKLKRMYYIILGIFNGFLFNPKVFFPNKDE